MMITIKNNEEEKTPSQIHIRVMSIQGNVLVIVIKIVKMLILRTITNFSFRMT